MRSRHPTSILAVLLGVATVSGMAAQTPTSPAKMPQHHDSANGMKGMKGMHGSGMTGMMAGPHQILAMAYRDNIVTFGRALHGQLGLSPTVNLDLARPAVAEMRRSFDQMKEHHQAHMQMMMTMKDNMKPAASEPMQHMETHLTALGEHLTALEAELNVATPSAAKASEHTAMVLKECGGMSSMPAKTKPHQMKGAGARSDG